MSRPWSWLAWALILPAAALATPGVLSDGGPVGLIILWTLAVIVGGVIEGAQFLSNRGARSSTSLSTWVFRAQGNLSVVALVISIALLWQGLGWILPGLWLLLLGHSLYTLGGMAFAPLRTGGLLYQLGGLLALWPHQLDMRIFAVTTFVANLWVAWSIWRGKSGTG